MFICCLNFTKFSKDFKNAFETFLSPFNIGSLSLSSEKISGLIRFKLNLNLLSLVFMVFFIGKIRLGIKIFEECSVISSNLE